MVTQVAGCVLEVWVIASRRGQMRAYTRRRCVPSLHALRRSARWCHAASVRGHGGPRSPRAWARRPQGRAHSTRNTQTDKDLCARAACAALARVGFPPSACNDSFMVSASSPFSVSVRLSHFAKQSATCLCWGVGAVGALARASEPSVARARSVRAVRSTNTGAEPSRALARASDPSGAGNGVGAGVGAVWCAGTGTGAGRGARASSGGGAAGVVAAVRRGERLRERARKAAHAPSTGTGAGAGVGAFWGTGTCAVVLAPCPRGAMSTRP